ncbi:MAG: hypothetical protein JRI46_11030 [Deltaproteobacteria bacterium]|nr:hypothetical protein [Deltaproteobacteria bacterium]
MKVYYLQPITDDILIKKLHRKMGEEILHYDRISSTRREEPYETKNELDLKYVEHVKGIINDVGDFIRGFLPKFFSSQRADFDYVRKYNVGFLDKHKLLVKVRAKTNKGEKELSLSFDLPSFLYVPRILYRMKGQYVYLHNHLESRISFVIGNRENPKTDDYFIDDAMEELWHLAIHPYLIKKLNRNLGSEEIKPDGDMPKILMEGEYLAKAFTLVSFDEFKEKKRYDIPSRETKDKGKNLVDKIKGIGIKKALKEISRPGIFDS